MENKLAADAEEEAQEAARAAERLAAKHDATHVAPATAAQTVASKEKVPTEPPPVSAPPAGTEDCRSAGV